MVQNDSVLGDSYSGLEPAPHMVLPSSEHSIWHRCPYLLPRGQILRARQKLFRHPEIPSELLNDRRYSILDDIPYNVVPTVLLLNSEERES